MKPENIIQGKDGINADLVSFGTGVYFLNAVTESGIPIHRKILLE